MSITPYHLKRIIEARVGCFGSVHLGFKAHRLPFKEVELNSPAHLNMETLLAHAESTASTLNYILLAMLGQSSSETFSHAASHLGAAQTLTTLLRALPYHASKGYMVIPASITAKNHVNQEDVFRRGPDAAGIEDAVYEFAVVANDHLMTAREMFRKDGKVVVPPDVLPVFLGAVSVRSSQISNTHRRYSVQIPVANYLRQLEACNFNAFNPKLQVRDSLRLPWDIWLAQYRKSF